MRVVQLPAINQIALAVVPDPLPATGEVVVSIHAAALNHRDVWIKLGQYAGLKWPCIPGSDGAGIVTEVGSGVDPAWVYFDSRLTTYAEMNRLNARGKTSFITPPGSAAK